MRNKIVKAFHRQKPTQIEKKSPVVSSPCIQQAWWVQSAKERWESALTLLCFEAISQGPALPKTPDHKAGKHISREQEAVKNTGGQGTCDMVITIKNMHLVSVPSPDTRDSKKLRLSRRSNSAFCMPMR